MTGKKILLTGGTRGLGRAMAEACLEAGHQVAFSYRQREDLARELMEAWPGQALGIQGDLKLPEDNERLLQESLSFLGGLDVLVNNAGREGYGFLADMDPREVREILETNLMGTLDLTRLAIPHLIRSQGLIVTITSIWGKKGASCEVPYAMSKAALEAMSISLARELGPSGVRSLTLAPGLFDTEMNQGLELEGFVEEIPLKRMGDPREAARLLLYLIREGSYLNGASITIDGGWSI